VEREWRFIAIRALTYAGEHAFRLLLTAVVGVLVARHLGPEGLGLLSYAQSVFKILLPLVVLGLPTVLVREFSTRSDWRQTLASALVVQTPAALLVGFAGFFFVAATRGYDTKAILTALALVPLPLFTLSQSLRSYLGAIGRSRTILVSGIVAAFVASSVKILGVIGGADVWVFSAAVTLEVGVVALGLARGVPGRMRISAVRHHVRAFAVRELFREAWPLLLASFAFMVYLRADVLMLGLLAGDEETGLYSAAAQLSEVWYFLPMAAVAALRPTLSRLYADGDFASYAIAIQRFMAAAAAVSYIALGGMILLGPAVVVMLYGNEFAPAGRVLQLHILAAPFIFLGVAADPWFLDRRLGRVVLMRSVAGAIVNVALNLALIPPYGARGAAVATLVSYLLASVLLNGLWPAGRPVLRLQVRALLLRSSDPYSAASRWGP
jgi:polysaccharide transporter, PST family